MASTAKKYFHIPFRLGSLEKKADMLMARTTEIITTTGGNALGDKNSITAAPRGPLMMQDHQLLEKPVLQNRERLSERTVQAKGTAAYGTHPITHDITKYSKVVSS